MEIAPFATEDWFARYEFRARHLLAASDCETVDVAELLALANVELDALTSLRLGYTESQGAPELRAAIAGGYPGVTPDDIVVLGAPEEGIYLTLRAVLEPGDDVVLMTPCYDSLRNVAEHIGAAVHPWALRPVDGGWAADLADLERLLAAARPKLVIVNLPHNPTGFLPSRADFGQLLALVAAAGARLFCDEMYRGLERRGVEPLPSAAEGPDDRAVVLSGLSKSHGLPGLRCGWLVVRDPALRTRLIGWKHYTTICAAGPSELLATAGLRATDALLERNRARIGHNIELAERFFAAHAATFTWRPPRAGSVALVETRWPDAAPVCRELAREHGVVLLPGACLGAPASFVRFGLGRDGFGAGLEALGRALARLGR